MAKVTASTRRTDDFATVFRWLRAIAERGAALATVVEDSAGTYTLAAEVGPATVKLKGPKSAGTRMPVVYLRSGKAYVSYHLMGLYMNPTLTREISAELGQRKQGKTCFNFRRIDESLAAELDRLTKRSVVALRHAGYIL
jgi:hypothetical protein